MSPLSAMSWAVTWYSPKMTKSQEVLAMFGADLGIHHPPRRKNPPRPFLKDFSFPKKLFFKD
jgi:hypothetical protein